MVDLMASPVFGYDGRTYIEIAGHALHYEWLGSKSALAPIVFLHEGLGSVDLWRGFPRAVVETTGHPALVYSRYGHGWSDPLGERRDVGYMHDEALVLGGLIDNLIDRPPILVGHSDGASIALIHAGSGNPVEALVLLAPHVFVEPETRQSIEALRLSFPGSEMAEKMEGHHGDAQATFWRWNDIWLDERFQDWNIERFLGGIECPVLLIQGDADEFGTEKQLDAIERGVSGPVQRLVVAGAGHSPHLSDLEITTTVAVFVGELS
ncbi:alpha/beta hydrolase [soil metagenome]